MKVRSGASRIAQQLLALSRWELSRGLRGTRATLLWALAAGLVVLLAVAAKLAGSSASPLPQLRGFAALYSVDVARELRPYPPSLLSALLLGTAFTPAFVVATSAGAVAADVASGTLRHVKVRTSAAIIVLGKVLGQLALFTVRLAVLMIGVALVPVLFEARPLVDVISFAGKVTLIIWLVAVPYLALAILVSSLARTEGPAILLGLTVLLTVGLLRSLLQTSGVEGALVVFPRSYEPGLFSSQSAQVVNAALASFLWASVCVGVAGIVVARKRA